MIWTEVSPGIKTGYFMEWHITEIELSRNVYGVAKYTYIAIYQDQKLTGTTWPKTSEKILMKRQSQFEILFN